MNNAGLPGTGLGGLFYLLLAFWMPVAELVATVRGRSSLERWRLVGAQFALACAIAASVAASMVAYNHVAAPRLAVAGLGVPAPLASVVIAVVVLALLVTVLRVWAVMRTGPKTAPPRHRADTGTARRLVGVSPAAREPVE